jgi:hypothetical protein
MMWEHRANELDGETWNGTQAESSGIDSGSGFRVKMLAPPDLKICKKNIYLTVKTAKRKK